MSNASGSVFGRDQHVPLQFDGPLRGLVIASSRVGPSTRALLRRACRALHAYSLGGWVGTTRRSSRRREAARLNYSLGAMKADSLGPKVEILSVAAFPGGQRITCRFSQPYGEPVAPGGLYTDPLSGQEAFAVHRATNRSGDQVTFESFGAAEAAAPVPGSSFFYRGWWVKAAMAAAVDTDARWERLVYPNDGTHEHCLFTSQTMSSYTGLPSGYWSAKHGWITEQAYCEFIVQDIYRLRAPHGA